jgi:hypothetical protein
MVFALPAAFWIALAVSLLVAGGLVFYALYRKGDVSAEFSYGLTTFKLEAKDRVRRVEISRRN